MSAPSVKLWQALEGFRLIPDERLVIARQIRFPRSKRRRIRRKWARRPANHLFSPSPFLTYDEAGKTVVGHPATLVILRHKIFASKQADARAHNACAPCFEEG